MIEKIQYILIMLVILLIVFLSKNKEYFEDCRRKPEPEIKSDSHNFLLKEIEITKGLVDFDPECEIRKQTGKFPNPDKFLT